MAENNFSLMALSGVFAVGAYILLVLFLFMQFSAQSNPIRYSAPVQTTFSVAVVEEKQKAGKTQQVSPRPQPKKATETPKKETTKSSEQTQPKAKNVPTSKQSASKSANTGVGINELFAQVEAKVPVNKEALKPQNTNEEVAFKRKAKETVQQETAPKEAVKEDTKSQEKQENVNKAVDELLSNLEVKQNLSFAMSEGEYDEFYAKVHEILASHWNPWSFTRGLQSKVLITIDNQGNFNYKISQNSGDRAYDQTLLEFLERMKSVQFPPYTKGLRTNIEITFKDSEG